MDWLLELLFHSVDGLSDFLQSYLLVHQPSQRAIMASRTARPHVVIVMGSFQTPWHYSFLKEQLEKCGYEASIVQLPSTGGWTPVPDALTKDVAAVREAVTARIGNGKDVVVVAHSQGGVGASGALEGLGKTGSKPGVLHVIYLQSFLLEAGITSVDKVGGNTAPWMEVRDGLQIPHNALEMLYHDVSPPELAEKAASLVMPNSRSVSEGMISYVPWNDMPCTYVLCEQDKAVPPEVARWLIASAGVKCQMVRLESGHSPFLSMPERTARVVRWVAGEQGVDLEGVKFGESGEGKLEEGWVGKS